MKIEIPNSTYLFLLLFFLAGYFNYLYLFLLIIFIHESGHYIFGLLCNIEVSKIIIYPFGGITVFNTDLNISIKKEFICLIGGITFQLLFLFFIYYLFNNNLIDNYTFKIIKRINYILISFNFMPILPLDGGKLLNLFLDLFFSYKYSNYIAIIISTISTIVFIMINKSILSLILALFLIKGIILEIINLKLKYNKFILERYLNKYKFKKIKKIKNINQLKRDCYHIIDNTFEMTYLTKMFDRY